MKIDFSVRREDRDFSKFTFSDEGGIFSMIIEMQETKPAQDKLKIVAGLLKVMQVMEKICNNVTYKMDLPARTLTLVGNLSEALDLLYERKEISKTIYDMLHHEDEPEIHNIIKRSKTVTFPQAKPTRSMPSKSSQTEKEVVQSSMQNFLTALSHASTPTQVESTQYLLQQLEQMGLHTTPPHSPDITVGGKH